MSASPIIQSLPLGARWPCIDPFLFCAHHNDAYPAGDGQLGVQAVLAGADVVMVCHEYPHETDVYLGLLEAAENGTLSKERLDASVKRIVKMKLLHKQ